MGIREDVLTRQGDALKAWRDAQPGKDEGSRLSQTTAAERIGSTQGTWGAWESGRKAPDGYYAGKLEELTGGAVKAAGWAYPRRGTSAQETADEDSGTDVTGEHRAAG